MATQVGALVLECVLLASCICPQAQGGGPGRQGPAEAKMSSRPALLLLSLPLVPKDDVPGHFLLDCPQPSPCPCP